MLIYPIDRPIKASGHIQIMYGNLAPEGCVGKITGKEGLEFEGPARVFDSEELMLKAVEAGPQQFKVSRGSIFKACRPVVVGNCIWVLQLFHNNGRTQRYKALECLSMFTSSGTTSILKSYEGETHTHWSMSGASCESAISYNRPR